MSGVVGQVHVAGFRRSGKGKGTTWPRSITKQSSWEWTARRRRSRPHGGRRLKRRLTSPSRRRRLGYPAEILLKAGTEAGLLVVGTRGRHGATGAMLGSVSPAGPGGRGSPTDRRGFTGLLLGSVGLRLLHRADSPVMVAHARPVAATAVSHA